LGSITVTWSARKILYPKSQLLEIFVNVWNFGLPVDEERLESGYSAPPPRDGDTEIDETRIPLDGVAVGIQKFGRVPNGHLTPTFEPYALGRSEKGQ
jgi:hypothetical protein